MSKNTQLSLLLVIALISGIFIGRINSIQMLGKTSQEDYQEKYESLKNKLGQLNQVDFEEYLSLKDQRERYQKADEILGKMILIFLADLGFNVSQDKMKMAEQMIGRPITKEDLAPAPARVTAESSPSSAVPLVASAPVSDPRAFQKAILKNREKGIEEITSDEQAKKFLENVVVDDLYDYIRTAKTLNADQIQSIHGTFVGKVVFDDKTLDPWDVEMTLEGFHQEKDPEGSFEVKVFKMGESKPFSHSNGQGSELRHANGVSDSQAMLINANGDDGLFQLYAPKKLNMLVGNYYGKKKGSNAFAKVGVVTLQRR